MYFEHFKHEFKNSTKTKQKSEIFFFKILGCKSSIKTIFYILSITNVKHFIPEYYKIL